MERELLLLGMLRQKEMHGYRIVEQLEREYSLSSDLKKPTVYFLLGKMADQGWVSRSRERKGKRPPRWVYRITTAGEQQFQRMLRDNLATFWPAVDPGDIGLAFLHVVPPGEAGALLGARRQRVQDELEALRQPTQDQPATELLVAHLRARLTSELRWLGALIEQAATGAFHSAPGGAQPGQTIDVGRMSSS
jgi:DNA-binding PadR family transcriptional regulator